MNIYLIGYRCTGKTSVGKLLARKMEMEFADTDLLIELRAGMHISNYVWRNGWDSFRDLETEIISELSEHDGLVAATGGGIVLRENNIGYMKSTGLVVWLTARPETILARMEKDEKTDHQRPALSVNPLAQEVHETLEQRTPLYENACHVEIQTDDQDTEKICDSILRSDHVRKYFRNHI